MTEEERCNIQQEALGKAFKDDDIDYNDYKVVKELSIWVSVVMTTKGQHYNYLNDEGQLLSETWFDCAYDFHEGFARVVLNGKWNFISAEGQLLSETWFDDAIDFNEGLAAVELNGKLNFVNTEGQLLSEIGFDDAYPFNEGFARVNINGQWYTINSSGRIVN